MEIKSSGDIGYKNYCLNGEGYYVVDDDTLSPNCLSNRERKRCEMRI